MKGLKFIVAFFVLVSFVVIPAYGDGLASETLPPSIIGNRNVTLSINSSPFLIDNFHVGTQVNFALLDVNSQQPIPGVTLSIAAFKDDNSLFGHIFKSDNGNFLINMTPEPSGDISVDETGGILSGITGSHSGSYDVKGPIFNEGGLYRFKIEILTMGSYDNQVSKSYNAAISIPETKYYQTYDNQYGKQNVTIIAFYDKIGNFQYDSNKQVMSFSMPFDWSDDNVKQVSVVHQEIKIPRTFSDFIVTKYDAQVNGVKLNDKAISIDDYSSDERIVHLILYKQDLANVAKMQQNQKQEMDFTVSPSNETGFPIIQYTRNAQYKVSLSWDPPKILPGTTTKFRFQVLDPYLINKTVDSIGYDFSIIAGKMGSVFHTSGQTNSDGSASIVSVPMPANYTGPITIAFENLNGNSFAESEFPGVVSSPPVVPEFPYTSILVLLLIFSFTIILTRILPRKNYRI
ncbi:MAG: hypothetical protein KGI28_03580 [Thaumarchaeota archaeon]|nr:hypothetical protein [Nitrososphaerota archaeon]